MHVAENHLRILSIAMYALCAAALFSDDIERTEYNWRNPNEVSVSNLETAFTSRYIGATKNESVFVWVYSPQGPLVLFSMFHIDSIFLNRWGMYALVIDPAGESHWFTHLPRNRSISFDESRLSVTDGATTLTTDVYANPVTSVLSCDFAGFTCNIEFVNRLPPWKPGTGRLDFTDDGKLYQMRILVSPWSYATGSVAIDGAPFPIVGDGYIIKTRFSNPLNRFSPAIHAIKLYDEDEFLYLLDVTLADAYDNRVVPSLAYARNDKWSLTSPDYRLEVIEYSATDEYPHPLPRKIEISHNADGHILEGTFTVETLLNVTDVLDELPELIRQIIAAFFRQPVYYRFIGTFEGIYREPDGTVHALSLRGPYEYTVVH